MNSWFDSCVVVHLIGFGLEHLCSVSSFMDGVSGDWFVLDVLVRGFDKFNDLFTFVKGWLDGHVVMDLLGRSVEDPS